MCYHCDKAYYTGIKASQNFISSRDGPEYGRETRNEMEKHKKTVLNLQKYTTDVIRWSSCILSSLVFVSIPFTGPSLL